MDVTYINPFVSAIIGVFQNISQQELEIGTLRLKSSKKTGFSISGVIGLSGNARGFVAISYSKALATKIVTAFLGMEVDEFSPYVADGVGEITNMVAGNAKRELADFRFELSLPTVVVGVDHRIEGPSGTPVIVIPLKCEWGEFEMEVSIVVP